MDGIEGTRIIISHQLSTIRDANRVLMMEAGKIVQERPFKQPIAEPTLFVEMMRR